MSRAKELADQQRAADKAHHEKRIAWLESENPTWACGAPVLPSDANQMLRSSRIELEMLRQHGMCAKACNCDPPCNKPG